MCSSTNDVVQDAANMPISEDEVSAAAAFRKANGNGNPRAFILGATGETGKALLRQLLDSGMFSEVTSFGRREPPYDGANKRLLKHVTVDFSNLKDEEWEGFTHGFCCLGTTRAKAGSAEAFRKVDYDYIVGAASKAKAKGVRHFSLVSSQGASASSWLLYPKTKGQTEEAVKALGFERLSIFRPGLLFYEKREESRGMEGFLVHKVVPAFSWMVSPKRVGSHVETVARAMRLDALRGGVGGGACATFENKDVQRIGEEVVVGGEAKGGASEEAAVQDEETQL